MFPGLFSGAPVVVREFLSSALQLRNLQKLYDAARLGEACRVSQAILEQLEIDIQVTNEDLERIPRTGAVVVVANHPYGLLDGLILDTILGRVRSDFHLLVNSVLSELEGLRGRCIPVDVFTGKAATATNATHLRHGVKLLQMQEGIACFPSGEVSHWERNRFENVDPEWSSVPTRCAAIANAPVVPIFFKGANSVAFQVAGLVHPRLRTVQLAGELLNKKGRKVEVCVGNPISAREIKRFDSYTIATDYVRARTYLLEKRDWQRSNKPPVHFLPQQTKRVQMIASQTLGFQHEIERLEQEKGPIVENETYCVYAASGVTIPGIVDEIGRVREATFRAVGEGTGEARDIDGFDPEYLHLILWHKRTRSIAGAYRLTWTSDVLPKKGISGLYTSTLFYYKPDFFRRLGPAVELGRSFVAREFQKDYSSLLLLWQAIARCIADRPDSPVLFGAVSISAEYSETSRQLLTEFVSRHSFDRELAQLAMPRHPFRPSLQSAECKVITRCIDELDDLSGSIEDMGDTLGIPVLLRHYLKLGGRVAGFNLDRKFSDTLDGLLIVDLRKTAPRLLARYMGTDRAALFQEATRSKGRCYELTASFPGGKFMQL